MPESRVGFLLLVSSLLSDVQRETVTESSMSPRTSLGWGQCFCLMEVSELCGNPADMLNWCVMGQAEDTPVKICQGARARDWRFPDVVLP